MVPLTTYEDYADVLLLKKEDMLPDKPIIWIQTTWEGGKHPIKVAPYTSVLECATACSLPISARYGDAYRHGRFPGRLGTR